MKDLPMQVLYQYLQFAIAFDTTWHEVDVPIEVEVQLKSLQLYFEFNFF